MENDTQLSRRRRKRRTILIVLLVLAATGGFFGYRYYNMPAARAEDQQEVAVNAGSLLKAYESDSATANRLYLDKWVAVSGTVTGSEVNQSGQLNVFFGSEDDPLAAGVSCTMRDKNVLVKPGEQVTLKGRCTGMPSDVTVTECILLK